MRSMGSFCLTAATLSLASYGASAIHLPPASFAPLRDIFNANTISHTNANFPDGRPQSVFGGSEPADVKVPVQLGVMSKCPDALLCERRFTEVLEQVSDKVDLSLVYVGKIDASQPDFGVWCMHGPGECAGNVQQLCVAKYAPFPNFWEFVSCQNYQGRENVGEPDVALKCAETAGIDWEAGGAGACAGLDGSGKGTEGVELLQESVKLGKAVGITKSCTVLISGKAVCVHDGTWKDCENGHTTGDFVRQIEDEYQRLNQ